MPNRTPLNPLLRRIAWMAFAATGIAWADQGFAATSISACKVSVDAPTTASDPGDPGPACREFLSQARIPELVDRASKMDPEVRRRYGEALGIAKAGQFTGLGVGFTGLLATPKRGPTTLITGLAIHGLATLSELYLNSAGALKPFGDISLDQATCVQTEVRKRQKIGISFGRALDEAQGLSSQLAEAGFALDAPADAEPPREGELVAYGGLVCEKTVGETALSRMRFVCSSHVEVRRKDQTQPTGFLSVSSAKSEFSGGATLVSAMSAAMGAALRSTPCATPLAVRAPEAPRSVILRSSDGSIKGSLSEILPGSGAYVSSGHVLEGVDETELRRSLATTGEKDFRFFHLYAPASTLPSGPFESGSRDIVLAIPADKLSSLLEPIPRRNGSTDCASGGSDAGGPDGYRLKADPRIAGSVALGDAYYSTGLGTLGNGEAISQVSTGEVAAAGLIDHFILPPKKENHATLRSSGSLVYVRDPKAGKDDPWKLGGVVRCKVPDLPPSLESYGIGMPGGVVVVSAPALLNAEVRPVGLSEVILRKPRSRECVPVDGKGGGG